MTVALLLSCEPPLRPKKALLSPKKLGPCARTRTRNAQVVQKASLSLTVTPSDIETGTRCLADCAPPPVTTFPPFSFPYAYLLGPRSYSPFHQPRHLPFHYHTSLRHHLPMWLFLILISDSDSLRLPSYLRCLIRYFDPLWQALLRPLLYLTLASTMTKP